MGWESAWSWVGSVGKYKPRGGWGREGLGGCRFKPRGGGSDGLGSKSENLDF